MTHDKPQAGGRRLPCTKERFKSEVAILQQHETRDRASFRLLREKPHVLVYTGTAAAISFLEDIVEFYRLSCLKDDETVLHVSGFKRA